MHAAQCLAFIVYKHYTGVMKLQHCVIMPMSQGKGRFREKWMSNSEKAKSWGGCSQQGHVFLMGMSRRYEIGIFTSSQCPNS